MKVLLTNDDGPQSPLLAAFVSALAAEPWCKELRVVVPAFERSWISKATTRFDELMVGERVFGQVAGFTVGTVSGSAGNPADCVELGLWNLYQDPADLVLSGINMGPNIGLALAASSGTVGGALEAHLNGVPTIALSAMMPKEMFKAWLDGDLRGEQGDEWMALAKGAARVCGLLVSRNIVSRAPLLSVNLPWTIEPSTPVRLTRLKRTAYRGLFEGVPSQPGRYRHRFKGTVDAPEEAKEAAYGLPNDVQTLLDGEISVTALDDLLTSRNDSWLEEAVEALSLPGSS